METQIRNGANFNIVQKYNPSIGNDAMVVVGLLSTTIRRPNHSLGVIATSCDVIEIKKGGLNDNLEMTICLKAKQDFFILQEVSCLVLNLADTAKHETKTPKKK